MNPSLNETKTVALKHHYTSNTIEPQKTSRSRKLAKAKSFRSEANKQSAAKKDRMSSSRAYRTISLSCIPTTASDLVLGVDRQTCHRHPMPHRIQQQHPHPHPHHSHSPHSQPIIVNY